MIKDVVDQSLWIKAFESELLTKIWTQRKIEFTKEKSNKNWFLISLIPLRFLRTPKSSRLKL